MSDPLNFVAYLIVSGLVVGITAAYSDSDDCKVKLIGWWALETVLLVMWGILK